MRTCVVLLLASFTVLAAEPEEVVAMLLSSNDEVRGRGQQLVTKQNKDAVLRLLASWAHDRDAWSERLARRLTEAKGEEKRRLDRMLGYLKNARTDHVGLDLYVFGNANDSVLGDADVVMRNDLAPWWEKIAERKGVEYLRMDSRTARDMQTDRFSGESDICYIDDFDIEVGQGTFIAGPVIGVYRRRVTVSWRGVVSRDRKFISIDIDITYLDVAFEEKTKSIGKQEATIQVPTPPKSHRVRRVLTMPVGGVAALRISKTHMAILQLSLGGPRKTPPPKISGTGAVGFKK